WRAAHGARGIDPGLCGQAMNADRLFGPRVGPDNVSFRLWAPGARRVDLIAVQAHNMQDAGDGWFETTVAGARPGFRYKFRIDGEFEVPDPASRFQPEDVHGPSEVTDEAFDWQAREW